MSTRPSKELFAYAFIAQEYLASGSALDGVSRLLAHLVSQRSGSIFSSETISKDVSTALGLELSPLVVEGLVPSLEKAGVLEALTNASGDVSYKCKKLDEKHYFLKESEVLEILAKFRTFATGLLSDHKLRFKDEDLDNAFLSFLVTADFLSSWFQADKSEFRGNVLSLNKQETVSEDVRLHRSLDTVCALFVRDVGVKDEALFGKLVEISWGAVLVEVVTALQVGAASATASGLSDLAVFVDSPILLDLLDLGDEEQHKYAEDLFDLLVRSKASVMTFSHVVEEMRSAVETTLARFSRGEPFSGPLAGRLRSDPGYELFARQTIHQVEDKLSGRNVKIVPDVEFETPDAQKYFSSDHIDSLRSRVGELHKNVDRRDRDAKSIAYVIRMRRGLTASPVSSSRYVFVTRNIALCKIAKRYVVSTGLVAAGTAPPCVTDRQLAGILWFCSGSPPKDAFALTRQKIIANCASAVAPRLDLVTRMGQVLFEKRRDRLLEYEALMRDKRAALCLTRETLNVPSLVDANSAEELLAKMRSTLGEEQRADFDRERARLNAAFEVERNRLESDAKALTTQVSQAKGAVEAKNVDLLAVQKVVSDMRVSKEKSDARFGSELRELKDSVLELRNQNERTRLVVIGSVTQEMTRVAFLLAVGVVLVYGAIGYAVQIAGSLAYIGAISVILFSMLGFWIVPQYTVQPFIRGVLTRITRRRLKRIEGHSGLELDCDEIVRTALTRIRIH